MFFCVPKTRQTRRTISAGRLLEAVGVAVAAGQDLLGQAWRPRSSPARMKAWKLVIRIVAAWSRSQLVGRDEVALAVVVAGVVGQQDPQPVADGDARA